MLDQYSQEQKARLLELRPEWQPFLTELQYEEGEEDEEAYVFVQLPSPADPQLFLTVCTYEEEVTIAFGVWEVHFNEYTSSERTELEDALAMVSKLQNEELVVFSYWQGERWVGSTICEPTESVQQHDLASQASAAKVLSWGGRFSREVAL